jgi:hypothetical protein
MPQEHNGKRPARRLSQRAEQAIVIVFSLVVSLPFCNKAFHIDDPLYLNIAHQILLDPLHPYDGLINWQQVTEPAWRVSISPPGYSYWLAAWLAVGVTSEWGLHAVGTFWLILLGLATLAWARRLGDWPLAATLLVLSSPIALAGQNLMLDVPMLALAVAAIAVYHRAADLNSTWQALLAGSLAGLSVNVKYAGVVAIGVMALDALWCRRWRLLAAPAVGVALLVLVQATLAFRDGTPQILMAKEWIERLWPSDARDVVHRMSTSIVYLGACVAWPILLAKDLMGRGVRLVVTSAVALAVAALAVWNVRAREADVGVAAVSHAAIFAWNGSLPLVWFGIQAVALLRQTGFGQAIGALWRADTIDRNRHIVLLAVWTIGFWYLGTLNGPFVAPRAILPCALSLTLIILAIIPVARLLDRLLISAGAALTMALGIMVHAGDYEWANIYRDHAVQLAAKYRPPRGTMYFLGHWGWQHYAAAAGMVQFDPARMRLAPGDVVVWPRNVDCPIPVALVLRGCREIDRVTVAGSSRLPRTRSPKGLMFLYGDTDRGRIPWGWPLEDDPLEEFVIYQCVGL